MNYKIRDVSVNDAQEIINILNPIIEEKKYTVLSEPFTLEEEYKFIKYFPTNGVFNVALDLNTESVVGFQNLEQFATYTKAFNHVGIIATYIKPEYRNKGIGKLLAESTFKNGKEKGYEKIFTYVLSKNINALEYYKKIGFKIIGTAKRQAKIGNDYFDETLIERFL